MKRNVKLGLSVTCLSGTVPERLEWKLTGVVINSKQ
jgi:hypothetical protein